MQPAVCCSGRRLHIRPAAAARRLCCWRCNGLPHPQEGHKPQGDSGLRDAMAKKQVAKQRGCRCLLCAQGEWWSAAPRPADHAPHRAAECCGVRQSLLAGWWRCL